MALFIPAWPVKPSSLTKSSTDPILYQNIQRVSYIRLMMETADRGRKLHTIAEDARAPIEEVKKILAAFIRQEEEIKKLEANYETSKYHRVLFATLKPLEKEAIVNMTMAKAYLGMELEQAYAEAREERVQAVAVSASRYPSWSNVTCCPRQPQTSFVV